MRVIQGISCRNISFYFIIKYSFLLQARMSPSPAYDISECNLDHVPSSTYILCEVFRKEILQMQCNRLRSLSGGGALKNLSLITILDVHSNEINNLPSDIVHLISLKVFF